jgi:hypothetical protein
VLDWEIPHLQGEGTSLHLGLVKSVQSRFSGLQQTPGEGSRTYRMKGPCPYVGMMTFNLRRPSCNSSPFLST